MGHDIIAFNASQEDMNRQAAELLPGYIESYETPHEFQEDLRRMFVVTQMRRSAFDKYNKALYLALGTEDLYDKPSGRFGDRWFDQDELQLALTSLDYLGADVDFAMSDEEIDALHREIMDDIQRQARDNPELAAALGDDDPLQFDTGCTVEDNLETEKRFLRTCIKYCRDNGTRVRVYFG